VKLVKLLFSAVVAWLVGVGFIALVLYFKNDGADFTVTDVSGFGVVAVVASGVLMVVLYLPSLYWLKRRRGGTRPRLEVLLLTGLLCNFPLFVVVLTLVERKMVLSEALGFIATFVIIGTVFGLGFTVVHQRSDLHRPSELR
jgi:hypothetical protein